MGPVPLRGKEVERFLYPGNPLSMWKSVGIEEEHLGLLEESEMAGLWHA